MAEIRKTLQNLTPATRFSIRVRAINEFGVFSPWSEALDITTGTDTSTPTSPTGLVLSFDTPTLVANWSPVQLNTDGTTVQDLSHYKVTLTSGPVSVSYDVTSPYFSYPLERNRLDFGGAQPEIIVEVQASDVTSNLSATLSGTATNEPPPDPTVPAAAIAGFTTVNITIPAQPIADLDGYELWHSATGTTGSFTFLEETVGGGNTFVHEVAQGSTNYYRYKVRDVFQQLSGLSPAATATTGSVLIDDEEPPPDITMFRVLDAGLDENQRAWIDLAWDENPANDLASYEIRYRRDGDVTFSSVFLGPDAVTYRFSNLNPSTTYQFQIRATDVTSNTGDWVPPGTLEVETDADTEAPEAPTGLTITPGIRTLILQWDANTEFDFNHYDVHVSTDTGFTPSEDNLYSSPGPGTVESVARAWDGTDWVDLEPDQTYYIRTFAYDNSGNKSDPSAEISATTRYVTVADIAAESITADRLATSHLLAAITVSGSIKTAESGARMELNSSGLIGYANDGVSENIRYLNTEEGPDGITGPGLVIAERGFVRSDNYVPGLSGWYFGAGSGDGLLEVNEGTIKAAALQIGVSTENLLKNSSFENYPASGLDAGLADDWAEYPNNNRDALVNVYARGTGVDVWGPNFLYQSSSQKVTTSFVAAVVGVMQEIDLSDTPIDASGLDPFHVTASVWVKMASTANGERLARVTLRSHTAAGIKDYTDSITLTDGGWHRVVSTAILTHPTELLEIHCFIQDDLVPGEIFYFEGAQVEFSAYVSTYTPAALEIPDNYIQSAWIQSLTADRIDSGVITAALVEIDGTGRIQSADFTNGVQGYQLSASGIRFENGSIDINGADGVVHIDDDGLYAAYAGVGTQFKVNAAGVFIGGDETGADITVDTVNERTLFSSNRNDATAYTFEIDTRPDPGENKALRLYDSNTGVESFYLTYDGLGYFAKGVIGTAGSGGNRIHNSSFETTKGSGSSANTGGLDYWRRYGAAIAVTQVPQGTVLPLHGGYSCQLSWSGIGGAKGIEQTPAVSGLTGSAVWPANSVWTLSFGMSHGSSPQLPTIGLTAGITIENVLVPSAANSWQQYVYRITVGASPVTTDLRIYFTGSNGLVWLDGIQLERGEIANSFNLMPEEMQWAVAPPMGIGDTIQSSNYLANSTGWKINGNGDVEFNSIKMRGRLDATAGGSGHVIQLGGSLRDSGHHGLTLSHSNWDNIFLRRDDGVIFFRVNDGGANSLTFDSGSGVLSVRGSISASSISGSSISTTNMSGGSITGSSINIGSGQFTVDSSGNMSAAATDMVRFNSAGTRYTINASGGAIHFYRSDFGSSNLSLDLNVGFTINTHGPDIMHCYRIGATGAAPFTFVDNSWCGFRFWSSSVGGGYNMALLTVTNDGITIANNPHYQNTTGEQGIQSLRDGLNDVGYCWHQGGHRAVRMTLGTNGVMYVRNNLDGAVTFDGIASRRSDKRDLRDLEKQHGKLKQIKAKRFKYNLPTESRDFQRTLREVAKGRMDPETHAKQMAQLEREQVGFVAEEMAEVFPEVVAYDDDGVAWGIRYQMLVPILWDLIQDLDDRLDKLEKKK